jgi:hypothetical protein
LVYKGDCTCEKTFFFSSKLKRLKFFSNGIFQFFLLKGIIILNWYISELGWFLLWFSFNFLLDIIPDLCSLVLAKTYNFEFLFADFNQLIFLLSLKDVGYHILFSSIINRF